MVVVVHCASPSCTAELPVPRGTAETVTLRLAGWVLERHLGDDRLRPYCPRCAD